VRAATPRVTVEYLIEVMARGFESKDVEYQQAEAERGASGSRAMPPLSETDRASIARRQTTVLSLARARADLVAASRPAHCRMLEQAIATLEAELARA
jgi:hypothetical protein